MCNDMDIVQVVDFISGVGFPIAITLIVLKYFTESQRRKDEEVKELKRVLDKVNETLNELVITIKYISRDGRDL